LERARYESFLAAGFRDPQGDPDEIVKESPTE
ncbi:MAG: hypothetical protein JWN48_2111, partial [Myxococcaceae bacterium]|nr:hypothetical protein [Myxococcaceae bacterium]